MASTVEILQSIINSMKIELNVSSIVDNNDNTYVLNVCNSQYLSGKYQDQNAFELTLGDNVYEILDTTTNTVTIKGDVLPSTGKYLLPVPKFYHGTITQTNIELDMVDNNFNITPMIYLRRSFSEQRFRNGNINREADITLYFLTQANFTEWQTTDFDKYSVKPMSNLLDAFIYHISNSRYIGKFDSYTIQDNIKFANFIDSKGYEKQIVNKHLSGVQLDITLPVKSNYTDLICKC